MIYTACGFRFTRDADEELDVFYLVEKIQTVLCCVVFLLNNVVIIEVF